VLYELKSYESAIALTPIQLPPRSKVMEVAVSSTHIIAVTTGVVVLIYMTLLTGLKSLKVCAEKVQTNIPLGDAEWTHILFVYEKACRIL
jgi:hypothetical protein